MEEVLKKRLRPLNIKVESEVLRPPKIKFLVRVLLLISIDNYIQLTHLVLNAWDVIHEPGKIIESYTKVIQSPKEPFSDFLHRLTKAVQIGIADPEAR